MGGRHEREWGQVDRQIEKGRRCSLLGRPGVQRTHPPMRPRRPSPRDREIGRLTQQRRGRSSSRCWGDSSRWETRSAGPCSPCATRKTSSPSGPLQPRRSPAAAPSTRLTQPLRPSGSLHPEAAQALRPPGLQVPSAPRAQSSARGSAPVPAPTPAPRWQEQVCRQPASVHADQDDAVQRAAAADGRLARVQEAHRLDARQLLLPQRKLQLRLRGGHGGSGPGSSPPAAVGLCIISAHLMYANYPRPLDWHIRNPLDRGSG